MREEPTIHETVVLLWVAIFDDTGTLKVLRLAKTEAELQNVLDSFIEEVGCIFEGHVSVMDVDVEGQRQVVALPWTDERRATEEFAGPTTGWTRDGLPISDRLEVLAVDVHDQVASAAILQVRGMVQ